METITKNQENILLKKANQGDSEAFARIYQIYAEKLFRFVRFKVSTRGIAEDITQEVFFKTWEYIVGNDKRIENIKAFLYRIARNLVINFYAEKERMPAELNENLADKNLMGLDFAGDKIDINLEVDKVKLVLKKLPRQYQEVIIMRFLDELTISEIAQILNKSKNSTYVLIHRAIKAIKKEL